MNSMRTLLSFAIALGATIAMASSATAQNADEGMTEYASIQIFPALDVNRVAPPAFGDSDDEKRHRDEVRSIEAAIRNFKRLAVDHLEGNGSEPNGFNRWFNEYLFAQMTQTDDTSLSQLGEMREAFFKTYLGDRVSQRQKVLNLTLPAMQAIVDNQSPDGKPFHPAVRMNAITVIGLLDSRRPDQRNQSLPRPMPEALNFLATVYANPAYPPHIRVGAMTGLKRHFEIDGLASTPSIPPAIRDAMIQECVQLASGGGTSLDDWSDDGRYWMQRLAVQTLGSIKQSGIQPTGTEVMDALVALVENNDTRDMLRYDAVDALGKIRYSGVQQDAVNALPEVLGSYLASVARQESAHLRWTLNDFIEKNILFGDKDYEVSGNVETGGNGRQNGSNRQMGAGGGAGGGLLDEGDGGGGGGNRNEEEVDDTPRVEIANYHLTDSRRRIKIVALRVKEICENAQRGSGSLAARAENKILLSDIAEQADELIAESDIGLNDEMEDEEDPLADNGFEAENDSGHMYKSTALDMADVFDRLAAALENKLPGGAAGGDAGNEFGEESAPGSEFDGNL